MSEIILFTPGKKKSKDLLHRLNFSAVPFPCILLLLFPNKPVVLIDILYFLDRSDKIFFFSLKHKQEAVSIRTQEQLLIVIFAVKD